MRVGKRCSESFKFDIMLRQLALLPIARASSDKSNAFYSQRGSLSTTSQGLFGVVVEGKEG
jgi:hypothetical protein